MPNRLGTAIADKAIKTDIAIAPFIVQSTQCLIAALVRQANVGSAE